MVFNYFKHHVYYVSINNFIYNVSINNFLEQNVYNNMLFMSLILDQKQYVLPPFEGGGGGDIIYQAVAVNQLEIRKIKSTYPVL